MTPYQDKGGADFMRYARAWGTCGAVLGASAGRKGRSTRAGEKVIWDDRKSQFARTSHARGGEGPVES